MMKRRFIETIVAHKTQRVASARRIVSESTLLRSLMADRDKRSLKAALDGNDGPAVRVIAEIKRASPSKGVFAANLDAAAAARAYASAGAAALSVLTDGRFFHGSLEDLRAARSAAPLPVLRKDFIVSTYQIAEAAQAGADALLLIVRITDDPQLKAYLDTCRDLGLEALVEVHSRRELEAAQRAGADLIGINNRDLSTFQTDLKTAIGLAPYLDSGQIAVVASGIRSRADVERNLAAGLNCFLIGEHLARAKDPGVCLKELLQPGKESF